MTIECFWMVLGCLLLKSRDLLKSHALPVDSSTVRGLRLLAGHCQAPVGKGQSPCTYACISPIKRLYNQTLVRLGGLTLKNSILHRCGGSGMCGCSIFYHWLVFEFVRCSFVACHCSSSSMLCGPGSLRSVVNLGWESISLAL